ncbi:uncharacterized protein [Maniola hyperantus]|uniref:uncharacterized protein n=1 Tax=Aphantopus hyperantus TaxID=2795564 RepID=UPI003747DF3E
MVFKACELIFILFSFVYGNDVHLDYHYGSGLHTGTLSCKSRLGHFYCQIKCDMKSAICVEDKCYCLNIVPAKEISPDTSPPIESKSLYALRPTVRHHIAHFCPDLDIARTCIRKCMAIGKPAFCGKDHVCYCGHKYTHTGEDDGGDADEIYAQFKDMYEKYFGTDYNKGSVDV